MFLHFLEVPIACFSNYGTLFFCLKSVLSVDEVVSMLIAIFFLCLSSAFVLCNNLYICWPQKLAKQIWLVPSSQQLARCCVKNFLNFSFLENFLFLDVAPSFLILYVFYLLLLQIVWGDIWQHDILKDCSGSISKNVKVLYNH